MLGLWADRRICGGEEFAPRSTIKFEAMAVVSSIKHKFLKDGTVEESTIMVIDPDSFRVRRIAEPPQAELPNVGTVTIEEADRVAAKMGLR